MNTRNYLPTDVSDFLLDYSCVGMLPYLALFPFDGNSRPLAAPDRLPREVPPSNALESSTSTVPEGARREHQ